MGDSCQQFSEAVQVDLDVLNRCRVEAMTLPTRIVSTLVSNRLIRRFMVRLSFLIGFLGAKIRLNPTVEISLKPFGVDAKFSIQLLRRDLPSLVEVFVNHVYDRFCMIGLGDVIVDCGAYIGEFTIYASRKVGNYGLVLAFEPNVDSFNLCIRNIGANRIRNATVFNTGLGRQEGTAYMGIDESNPGGSKIIWRSEERGAPRVAVTTLTQFSNHMQGRVIKLLKIDTEGSAVDIVNGAAALFEKRLVQNVAAEIHPGELNLERLLGLYGFVCLRLGSYLYASLGESQRWPPCTYEFKT